jgi:hypothetical protein
MLFWHISNRINKEILQNKRADCGKKDFADSVGTIEG